MADTRVNTKLVLKYSDTPGKIPLASDLVPSEPAFNLADGALFTKNGAGVVIEVGVPKSHVGSGGTTHAVATQSAAGFLSAADKTRLDSLTLTCRTTTGGTINIPI